MCKSSTSNFLLILIVLLAFVIVYVDGVGDRDKLDFRHCYKQKPNSTSSQKVKCPNRGDVCAKWICKNELLGIEINYRGCFEDMENNEDYSQEYLQAGFSCVVRFCAEHFDYCNAIESEKEKMNDGPVNGAGKNILATTISLGIVVIMLISTSF